MLDRDFRDGLTAHPFTRNNDYYNDRSTYKYTKILISGVGSKVPFIYTEPEGSHSAEGYIKYMSGPALGRRKLKKDQLLEVFNTAPIPIIVRFATHTLLCGKGFVGLFDDTTEDFTPIIVCMAPNKPSFDLEDTSYVVDRRLYRPEFRQLQSAIGPQIDTHLGEVLITPKADKYIGDRVKVPKMSNISQRRAFINDLINFSFDKVREELN